MLEIVESSSLNKESLICSLSSPIISSVPTFTNFCPVKSMPVKDFKPSAKTVTVVEIFLSIFAFAGETSTLPSDAIFAIATVVLFNSAADLPCNLSLSEAVVGTISKLGFTSPCPLPFKNPLAVTAG